MDKEKEATAKQDKPKRKRNRPAVSCVYCKSKKIKCSRTRHCSTCALKGIECVWAPGTSPSAEANGRDVEAAGILKRLWGRDRPEDSAEAGPSNMKSPLSPLVATSSPPTTAASASPSASSPPNLQTAQPQTYADAANQFYQDMYSSFSAPPGWPTALPTSLADVPASFWMPDFDRPPLSPWTQPAPGIQSALPFSSQPCFTSDLAVPSHVPPASSEIPTETQPESTDWIHSVLHLQNQGLPAVPTEPPTRTQASELNRTLNLSNLSSIYDPSLHERSLVLPQDERLTSVPPLPSLIGSDILQRSGLQPSVPLLPLTSLQSTPHTGLGSLPAPQHPLSLTNLGAHSQLHSAHVQYPLLQQHPRFISTDFPFLQPQLHPSSLASAQSLLPARAGNPSTGARSISTFSMGDQSSLHNHPHGWGNRSVYSASTNPTTQPSMSHLSKSRFSLPLPFKPRSSSQKSVTSLSSEVPKSTADTQLSNSKKRPRKPSNESAERIFGPFIFPSLSRKSSGDSSQTEKMRQLIFGEGSSAAAEERRDCLEATKAKRNSWQSFLASLASSSDVANRAEPEKKRRAVWEREAHEAQFAGVRMPLEWDQTLLAQYNNYLSEGLSSTKSNIHLTRL